MRQNERQTVQMINLLNLPLIFRSATDNHRSANDDKRSAPNNQIFQ